MKYGIFTLASILCVLILISLYKIFIKSGKKGWQALIPIYNFIVLIELAGLSNWYIVLFFIPFVNIYALFKTYIKLAHRFGKSTGFGIASIFFSFIYFPILAFGNARYESKNNEQNIINNNISINTKIEVDEESSNILLSENTIENSNVQVSLDSPTVDQIQNINEKNNEHMIEKYTDNNKKFCPNCGKELNKKDEICFMCGHLF